MVSKDMKECKRERVWMGKEEREWCVWCEMEEERENMAAVDPAWYPADSGLYPADPRPRDAISVAVIFSDVISCDAISRNVISCDAIFRDAISCDVISRDAIFCDVISCDVISCNAIFRDAISCDVISCDVMPPPPRTSCPSRDGGANYRLVYPWVRTGPLSLLSNKRFNYKELKR